MVEKIFWDPICHLWRNVITDMFLRGDLRRRQSRSELGVRCGSAQWVIWRGCRLGQGRCGDNRLGGGELSRGRVSDGGLSRGRVGN